MDPLILAYSWLPRQLPASTRALWRARLSPAGAARLSQDARSQSQSILGVALACRLLSAASGRPVEPGELRYTRNGKPHASGLPSFSIAHAGDWVVCALSGRGAVGVDIEPVVSRAALPRWRTVFDREELLAARSARAGLSIWAKKEATLKAVGGTLAELRLIRVRGRRVEFREQRWHSRAPRIAPDMIACLISDRPVRRLLLREVPAAAALAV